MNPSARRATLARLSAIRLRMRTVIAVLDEMLEQYAAELAAPLPRCELTAEQRVSAEAALREVEDSLRMLEAAAAESSAKARDWRARIVIAQRAQWADLVDPARDRAAEAERASLAYTREAHEARVFLHEWSVRVAGPRPGGISNR